MARRMRNRFELRAEAEALERLGIDPAAKERKPRAEPTERRPKPAEAPKMRVVWAVCDIGGWIRRHLRLHRQGRRRGPRQGVEGEGEGRPLRPVDQGADEFLTAPPTSFANRSGPNHARNASNGPGSQWGAATVRVALSVGVTNAFRVPRWRTRPRAIASTGSPGLAWSVPCRRSEGRLPELAREPTQRKAQRFTPEPLSSWRTLFTSPSTACFEAT